MSEVDFKKNQKNHGNLTDFILTNILNILIYMSDFYENELEDLPLYEDDIGNESGNGYLSNIKYYSWT